MCISNFLPLNERKGMDTQITDFPKEEHQRNVK